MIKGVVQFDGVMMVAWLYVVAAQNSLILEKLCSCYVGEECCLRDLDELLVKQND